jgi:hypothetical protein
VEKNRQRTTTRKEGKKIKSITSCDRQNREKALVARRIAGIKIESVSELRAHAARPF